MRIKMIKPLFSRLARYLFLRTTIITVSVSIKVYNKCASLSYSWAFVNICSKEFQIDNFKDKMLITFSIIGLITK